MFLVNPNSTRHPVAHPVHLHGHHYSVLSTGNSLSSNQNFPFLQPPTTTLSSPGPVPAKDPLGWVQEQDLLGTIPGNLDHPPRKDSMQTAPGSYTLIRWKIGDKTDVAHIGLESASYIFCQILHWQPWLLVDSLSYQFWPHRGAGIAIWFNPNLF